MAWAAVAWAVVERGVATPAAEAVWEEAVAVVAVVVVVVVVMMVNWAAAREAREVVATVSA